MNGWIVFGFGFALMVVGVGFIRLLQAIREDAKREAADWNCMADMALAVNDYAAANACRTIARRILER